MWGIRIFLQTLIQSILMSQDFSPSTDTSLLVLMATLAPYL